MEIVKPATPASKLQTNISKLHHLVLTAILAGFIALPSAACHRNPEINTPTLAKAEAGGLPSNPILQNDTIFPQLDEAQRQRYQPDLRLACYWEESGWLTIYVRNSSNKPIHIEPANFGVIIEGRSHPYSPATARALFPSTQLQPGEMATGRFRYPRLGNLLAQHLYFRHPQARSSRCLIRQTPD